MDHGSFWIAKLRRLFRTRNMPIICWHWIHDLVVCGWPLTKNLQLKCPLIDTSDLSNWNHAKTRFPSGRMLWICDVLRLSYSKFWRKKNWISKTDSLPSQKRTVASNLWSMWGHQIFNERNFQTSWRRTVECFELADALRQIFAPCISLYGLLAILRIGTHRKNWCNKGIMETEI